MKSNVIAILVLIITMTGFLASAAEDVYYGVDEKGQRIVTDNSDIYYMVHGGCREHSNDSALTYVWLYVSKTANTKYNSQSAQVITVSMFLNSKFGSIESTTICSFFRKALQNQIPVKMKLVPHPYWSNHFLVNVLSLKQVYENLEFIKDTNLLENFSVRESK